MSDGLGIAILALALVAVLVAPGEPRWLARPWLIKDPPRRAWLAAFVAFLLVAAIIRASV
jgi:hypothetical protein